MRSYLSYIRPDYICSKLSCHSYPAIVQIRLDPTGYYAQTANAMFYFKLISIWILLIVGQQEMCNEVQPKNCNGELNNRISQRVFHLLRIFNALLFINSVYHTQTCVNI